MGGFDEKLSSGEDTFMWLKFGIDHPEIYYLKNLSFTYVRRNSNSEKKIFKKRSINEIYRINAALELISNTKIKNEINFKHLISIVNIWIFRHLKFSIASFNLKDFCLLILLSFKSIIYSLKKWI